MAWGSKTSATQLTSITTIQYFSTLVTLNPGESAHVQVDVDFPTTPTDHALVSVFATLDPSSENWDDTAFMGPFLVPNSPDPGAISFVVSGCYKFRVGIQRTGSTNTITSADLSYRLNGISV